MKKNEIAYWFLSWIGLFANVLALPSIAYVLREGGPLNVANITLAASLAYPAAIVGIVASAGLLAERQWGRILAIIALSMVLSGTLPYGIIALVQVKELSKLALFVLFIAVLNLLALIYWCLKGNRRIRL